MSTRILSLFGVLAISLWGCSITPSLPNAWTLKTTSKAQNYFYCESCPAPTKLINQVYQSLEPDEPVTVVEPVAESIPKITKNTRSYNESRKHKKHKQRRKKVQTKPKQCIQWSS